MTVQPIAAVAAQQALATNKTTDAGANLAVPQAIAALRLAIGTYIEEYFAEDYMVDNHDYVYTVYPR